LKHLVKTHSKQKTSTLGRLWLVAVVSCFGFESQSGVLVSAQNRSLTPLQAQIEQQRTRLTSPETEERRDAITRLAAMRHPDASRAALAGLRDATPMVRATSAEAILFLPAEESAAALIPLLKDKDEFVRREAAYALGVTRSRTAVPLLIERLTIDKKDEVRSAAAVALGEISDPSAVVALSSVFYPGTTIAKNKKQRQEKNLFVVRSAIQAVGKMKSQTVVPTLIVMLQDEKSEDDVRREAALALGQIGDRAAIPALESVLMSKDPYLSQAAFEALRKIKRNKSL
jgi:HEAT repeat protein